jgi:hypothetical protein
MMKKLRKISDKSPFKVPENYFEEVNRKIIFSTAGYSSEVKDKSIFRKLRPYLAIAASIAILVAISFTAFHIFSSGRDSSRLPKITLNEFSENYLNDIDILTLEESTGFNEPDMVRTDIDSKDIIDYLVFENVDVNEIYEQL